MHRNHYMAIESGEYSSPRRETLERLARAFNVDVEELTGSKPIRQATPYESNAVYREMINALDALQPDDREEIVRHAMWTAERLRGAGGATIVPFPVRPADDGGDFPAPPIPLEDWIEKDTDRPRALHSWITPIDAEAAAGRPRETDDLLIPTTQLLNSLREVRDDRTKVVKIFGDSMHPVLRNGWKVLLDPARSLFQPGKIVMVYIKDEGTTIGMLAKNGDGFKIVKRNPTYGGPTEIKLAAGEWYPVGTVTTIVEAPVEIE